MGRTALIAGKGSIVNEAIKNLEDPLVIALIKDPEYPYDYIFNPGEVGKILKTLKKEQVDRVVFIGKVEKKGIFGGYKLDLTAIKLLATLRSFKDDEIMDKVVETLEREGIKVLSQKEILSNLLPEAGIMVGSIDEKLKGGHSIRF